MGRFVFFCDPDGNGWAVQELAPRPARLERDRGLTAGSRGADRGDHHERDPREHPSAEVLAEQRAARPAPRRRARGSSAPRTRPAGSAAAPRPRTSTGSRRRARPRRRRASSASALRSSPAPSTSPSGAAATVPTHIASARPVPPSKTLAEARVDQDVGAPQRAGDQREPGAERVETAGAVAGQREDPERRERDPQQVEPAPRAQQRDGQRTDELERHRDPERDAVDRAVEAEVHRREHEPEQSRERQLAAAYVPPAAAARRRAAPAEPNASRSRAVPAGPTLSKSVVASAAPNWTRRSAEHQRARRGAREQASVVACRSRVASIRRRS